MLTGSLKTGTPLCKDEVAVANAASRRFLLQLVDLVIFRVNDWLRDPGTLGWSG